MKSEQHDSVKEFHETYGLSIQNSPSLPDENIRSLRRDLLEEEFNEYMDGEEANDIVEISDALADMIYIIYGTAISYGIPLDEIFKEVHSSNMSKLGTDGKPIRRGDGKILKGPNYFEPKIEAIIKRNSSDG